MPQRSCVDNIFHRKLLELPNAQAISGLLRLHKPAKLYDLFLFRQSSAIPTNFTSVQCIIIK
jgi:hypothetical protein